MTAPKVFVGFDVLQFSALFSMIPLFLTEFDCDFLFAYKYSFIWLSSS